MEVNPFLKRLMKAKKEDVIHSSAYASAQNQCGMGAASTISFEERMKIEQNRQKIKGYGTSSVVGKAMGGGPRPKTYDGAARPSLPRNPGISR